MRRGAVRRAQGYRVQDSSCDGNQMRRKNKSIVSRTAQLRDHLRSMTMLQHAIGADVFIHFAEMRFLLECAASAGDARFSIDDDSAGRINRTRVVKRYER